MNLKERIAEIKRKVEEDKMAFKYLNPPVKTYVQIADEIITLQQEIIQANEKSLEAIAKDNDGDFSKYSKEELIEHIKNEAWFCRQALEKTKEIMEK